MTFDVPEGAQVRTLSSRLPVVVDVVAMNDGLVLATADAWKRPGALLFPSHSDAPEPPRAIVRITPQQVEPDPLSPGLANFVIGADFALDIENDGTEVDSGNNVLQRGLASDPSQFKIEVDSLRPRCRIQGPEGTVELRTEKRIQAGRWYRLRCSREDTTVRLAVFRIGSSTAPTLVEEVQAESSTGDLQWSEGTPLSVGGKLAANGAVIRSQTDQFNGVIAEPFLHISD